MVGIHRLKYRIRWRTWLSFGLLLFSFAAAETQDFQYKVSLDIWLREGTFWARASNYFAASKGLYMLQFLPWKEFNLTEEMCLKIMHLF